MKNLVRRLIQLDKSLEIIQFEEQKDKASIKINQKINMEIDFKNSIKQPDLTCI